MLLEFPKRRRHARASTEGGKKSSAVTLPFVADLIRTSTSGSGNLSPDTYRVMDPRDTPIRRLNSAGVVSDFSRYSLRCIPSVATLATFSQGARDPRGNRRVFWSGDIVSSMVTKKQNVAAHIEATGLSDSAIAKELGCSRGTVFRWRKGDRLPEEYGPKLADLLGISEADLLRPVGRPSIDALLCDATDEIVQRALVHVRMLLRQEEKKRQNTKQSAAKA